MRLADPDCQCGARLTVSRVRGSRTAAPLHADQDSGLQGSMLTRQKHNNIWRMLQYTRLVLTSSVSRAGSSKKYTEYAAVAAGEGSDGT